MLSIKFLIFLASSVFPPSLSLINSPYLSSFKVVERRLSYGAFYPGMTSLNLFA